jgi:hypothetical protein
MTDKQMWLVYVALAGLSWGTYVPLIFYGGNELGGKAGSRLMAILCVGVAYFVIAVLFPLGMFFTGRGDLPEMRTTGLVFSSLAGVAGAVGALCVIFASKSAVQAAKDGNLDPATYRLYIAPLIFGLAPVINTVVSAIWHPHPRSPFHFGFELPGWKLWLGIVLVGVGAALVLFSKEEAESGKTAPPKPAAKVALLGDSPQTPVAQPEAKP